MVSYLKDKKLTTTTEEGNAATDENGEHMEVDYLQASIFAIHFEIKTVHSDVHVL